MLLLPVLIDWAMQPTGIESAYAGLLSIAAAACAVGAALCAVRDYAAVRRLARMTSAPAANLVGKLPGRQTVLVTGATGFIGSRLVAGLTGAGHKVIALIRNPAKAEMRRCRSRWSPASIRSLRTPGRRHRQSRRRANRQRVVDRSQAPKNSGFAHQHDRRGRELIARLERKPAVLVSGSAIGWYGLWQDQVLTESAKSHACFSHELCDAWEKAARPAEAHGVRVVYLRIGLVIGTDGGFITEC